MEDIVRPELNLEKWPGMWQPARSNSKLNKVVLERKRKDGGISKIEITANSEYGAMTTETQKVMYALCKISEKSGHPRRIYFSSSKIAKILKKKWGSSAAGIIETGLYQLRSTFFLMKDVFYDTVSKKIVTFIDTFTILSVLKMVKEGMGGHITTEECYCEFNEYIYNNLVNNYVKPVLLDTFLSFGDDGIAQLLYSHLDLMLSKSNEYRRLSKEVFCDELKALGKEYQHLSRRKRTIERIESKVNGKKLSSGGVLKLWLEKSLKGNDYDLVAIKVDTKENVAVSCENKEIKKELSNITQIDKSKIEKLAKAIPPNLRRESNLASENVGSEVAKELVQHFHKKFFNLENVNANSKELKQANELVKEYGFTISKYIIEYAYNQAAETNYKIGQFGAVLEYAGRGAAQYEKDLKRKESMEKLESCPFCYGLIHVDVVAIENGKERRSKFKCPHDLEKLETTAKEKQIKIRLANGKIIDF